MIFWKTLPNAHRILVILAIGFVLNLVSQGLFSDYTRLVPTLAIHNYEFWRIITYPLASTGFWNLFSASLLLYFFGPEIEQLLRPERFIRYTLFFMLLHGLFHTLLLTGTTTPLAGPYSYALAVLIVFAYVYPSAEFSIFGIISLRAWVFALLFVAFSVISPLIMVLNGGLSVAAFLTGPIAGIAGGLLFAHIYFHKYNIPSLADVVRSRNRPVITQQTQPVTPVVKRTRTEYSPSKGKRMQSPAMYNEADDTTLDEHRLNDILDKISEQGRDSLSEEEIEFLEDYARRL